MRPKAPRLIAALVFEAVLAGLVVVATQPGIAGEQEAGTLIDRSRTLLASGKAASIRAMVRADRSAAYEAVHRLGAEGDEGSLRLAEAIAAAYAEVYSDRRLVDRIPSFGAWTREEREARAAAVALKTEGKAEYADGRTESALEKIGMACATFERIRDERERAWCKNAIAATRSVLRKGEEAIRDLQEARDFIDPVGDLRLLGAVESNLGLAFRGAGDLVSARRELERSVRRARDLGDRREEAARLVTLALILSELGEVDQAIVLYRQAVAIARETGEGEQRLWDGTTSDFSIVTAETSPPRWPPSERRSRSPTGSERQGERPMRPSVWRSSCASRAAAPRVASG